MSPIRVLVPDRELITQAHQFHWNNAGEFLFPRTEEQFGRIIHDHCLVVAVDEKRVIGLCYVTEDTEEERWEFGGIIVDPSQRGRGIASALGTIAISNVFLQHGAAVDPLIGHVHVDNDDPRHLLTTHLGFRETGNTECYPGALFPKSMRRNEHDEVCGDVFSFQRPFLSRFADRIEQKSFAKAPVDVELQFMRDPSGMADELRKLATS